MRAYSNGPLTVEVTLVSGQRVQLSMSLGTQLLTVNLEPHDAAFIAGMLQGMSSRAHIERVFGEPGEVGP